MRKTFLSALLSGAVLLGYNALAQSEKCALTSITEKAIAGNPSLEAAIQAYRADVMSNAATYEAEHANSANKTTASVTIPVVFHVILTQAQIDQIGGMAGVYARAQSQMDAINECFNAKNSDANKIPAAFQPVHGNAEINFAFAHRSPAGKATSGVEIKVAPAGFTGFGVGDGSAKNTSSGGLDAWNNKRYLNIWVVQLTDPNVLGYGYSPNYAALLGVPYDAGVVITYGAFGKKKGVNDFYVQGAILGRTLVHELGHFFNLWHVWGNVAVGSGSCTKNDPDPLKYDDGVTDTPPQKDANMVCPGLTTVIPNCTNTAGGEMFMNFMDYPGDQCVLMFTKGQVARMRAQLAPGGPSADLPNGGDLLNYPTDVAALSFEKQMFVSPNPSNGNINISIGDNTGLQNISIINMLGQTIKNINTGLTEKSYNFDLSGMAKGVYTIQCHFTEGTVTEKIVLQ